MVEYTHTHLHKERSLSTIEQPLVFDDDVRCVYTFTDTLRQLSCAARLGLWYIVGSLVGRRDCVSLY